MANGDVFRVTLKHAYTDVGIAVQHVLWFRQTSDSPVAFESDNLATVVGDLWTATVSHGAPRWLWAPSFHFQGIECQKMLDPFEGPVSGTGDVAGLGDDTGAHFRVPSVCSMVVTLHSTLTGRRGRGRVYLGGFAARRPNNPGFWAEDFAFADHGRWTAEYANEVLLWLNAFHGNFNGDTELDGDTGLKAEWGVWSRANGGATPPLNPAGFSPLVEIGTDAVVRVQRRREYGHGI